MNIDIPDENVTVDMDFLKKYGTDNNRREVYGSIKCDRLYIKELVSFYGNIEVNTLYVKNSLVCDDITTKEIVSVFTINETRYCRLYVYGKIKARKIIIEQGIKVEGIYL